MLRPDSSSAPPSLLALAVWPTLVFVLLFGLLDGTGTDVRVAGWFFDPVSGDFPLRHNFWASAALHDGAKQVLVAVALGVVVLWGASWWLDRLRPHRRDLGMLIVAIVVSLLAVQGLKAWSNVDCPWDWQGFGGDMPILGVFDTKPAELPRGQCFPGGHSSGGFSLLALYFAGRERRLWKLVPGLLIGSVFALDQWARGAHVPSHDLASAWLCWMAALASWAVISRNDYATRHPLTSAPLIRKRIANS